MDLSCEGLGRSDCGGGTPWAKLEVDLQNIAERYEISGGLILNVVRQVSLQSIAQGEAPISEKQLLEAIRRELDKDGKGL